MLCSAIRAFTRVFDALHERRGALLIRGPSYRSLCSGSRLCGAAWSTLHRVRDTRNVLSPLSS